MNENDSATGQTGAPYPQGPPPQGAATPALQQFFTTIRRQGIVRTEDRWFAGVAGGIARRLGIDVTVVRGLLALTLLVSGAALVVYALAWVLLPEEKDGRIHGEEALQGRFDGAILGAGLAFVLGVTWDGPDWLGWNEGAWFNAIVWIAVNVAIIALVVVAVRDHQRARAAGTSWSAPASTWSSSTSGPSDTSTSPAAETPYGPDPYPTTPYGPSPSVPYGPGPAPASGGPTFIPPYAAALPRPTPGPGASTVGVVLGLTILTAATLLALSRTGAYDGAVLLPTIAVLIGLCGAGIVLAGLRGRTSGSLSFWAVTACFVAVPALGWHQVDLDWGAAERVGLGDSTFVPRAVAPAEDGYAMGAGNWTLDLRELPEPGSGAMTIPVSFGAGELDVIVPDDLAWEADVALLAGEVSIEDGDGDVRTTQNGVLHPGLTFASAQVESGAPPTVVLDLQGGAGKIRIIEEAS